MNIQVGDLVECNTEYWECCVVLIKQVDQPVYPYRGPGYEPRNQKWFIEDGMWDKKDFVRNISSDAREGKLTPEEAVYYREILLTAP